MRDLNKWVPPESTRAEGLDARSKAIQNLVQNAISNCEEIGRRNETQINPAFYLKQAMIDDECDEIEELINTEQLGLVDSKLGDLQKKADMFIAELALEEEILNHGKNSTKKTSAEFN